MYTFKFELMVPHAHFIVLVGKINGHLVTIMQLVNYCYISTVFLGNTTCTSLLINTTLGNVYVIKRDQKDGLVRETHRH